MQCQHGLLEPKFSSAKHNKNPECMCLGSKLVSQNWCCKYTLVPSLFRNVGVAAFLFDWLYNFIFTRRWGLMWPLVQTVNLFSLKDGDLNSPPFFFILTVPFVSLCPSSQRKHPSLAEGQGQHQCQCWRTEATATAPGHQGTGEAKLRTAL